MVLLLEVDPSKNTLIALNTLLLYRGNKKEYSDIQSVSLGVNSEIIQAANVYRHLLKAMRNHIGKEDYKMHFREYVMQEFRGNCKLSDPSTIQQKIKLAHDYTFLLNSVHHHMDLLFSYNIAVDRSEEMKRILGKSAASVGLQLPDVYQP